VNEAAQERQRQEGRLERERQERNGKQRAAQVRKLIGSYALGCHHPSITETNPLTWQLQVSGTASAQSSLPLVPHLDNRGALFFCVKFSGFPPDSIGLSTYGFPVDQRVGSIPTSYAYDFKAQQAVRCDDASKNKTAMAGRVPALFATDTLGCGYDVIRQCVYFVRNGQRLGTEIKNVPSRRFYATVTLSHRYSACTLDFGLSKQELETASSDAFQAWTTTCDMTDSAKKEASALATKTAHIEPTPTSTPSTAAGSVSTSSSGSSTASLSTSSSSPLNSTTSITSTSS